MFVRRIQALSGLAIRARPRAGLQELPVLRFADCVDPTSACVDSQTFHLAADAIAAVVALYQGRCLDAVEVIWGMF